MNAATVLFIAIPIVIALAVALLLAARRQARLTATLREREERLEAQERAQREQGQALAALEQEVARMQTTPNAELMPMLQLAHEMRSPLAAIQYSVDVLLQGYAVDNVDLENDMLALISERAADMLARVNDFLRLGAVKRSSFVRKTRPVQILDVMHRLAPEMRVKARRREVELHLDIPKSLPLVSATHEDIEHVLANLANNAIKYTEAGGSVSVSLSEDENGVVGVVEDTGIGIAPEDMPHIFEEFYRAENAKAVDAHGTGLGLSIAKRVIELYGGHLTLESEHGIGTKFTFCFPKADLPENAAPASKTQHIDDTGPVVQIQFSHEGGYEERPVPGNISHSASGSDRREDEMTRWQLTNQDAQFRQQVLELSGQDVAECYQCGKCTAGCPVSPEMDLPPSQLMRSVQMGMRDAALSSHSIWLCASCETCTTRCPQELDPAGVIDALRQMAIAEKAKVPEREIPIFNSLFLGSVKQFGRIFEVALMGLYNLRSGHLVKDLLMAPQLFLKGKLSPLPPRGADVNGLKEMFAKAKELEAMSK